MKTYFILMSITITILFVVLNLTGCDQPYQEEEEVYFDTEVVEIDTEPMDTDCLESKACTIVWNPRCIVMGNADHTEVLRFNTGCVCIGEVSYPVNDDQICTGWCFENPIGANYCVDKDGVRE